MKHITRNFLLLTGLIVATSLSNGIGGFIKDVQARAGRPATPVSYAGVARRSSVGVGRRGVGVTRGAGVGARGAGAAPANRGGPVNRVGVR